MEHHSKNSYQISKSANPSSDFLPLQSWFKCSRLRLSWPHDVFHQSQGNACRKDLGCSVFECPCAPTQVLSLQLPDHTSSQDRVGVYKLHLIDSSPNFLWVERVTSFPFNPNDFFFFLKQWWIVESHNTSQKSAANLAAQHIKSIALLIML